MPRSTSQGDGDGLTANVFALAVEAERLGADAVMVVASAPGQTDHPDRLRGAPTVRAGDARRGQCDICVAAGQHSGGHLARDFIDAPSMRGDTGIAELGLTLTPSASLPLSFDLGVQGYAGKREGVTGSVALKWAF